MSRGRGAGRYAPSPSGDLHLGNLRTALVAWLFARASGRRFLMRIEDLDRDRDQGAADRQLADLARLGIDWDGRVVMQSECAARHEAALAALQDRGLVYECTCTRRDILAAPVAPHAPPGAYPGTCRDLGDADRAAARERIAPRKPALRLRVPRGTEAPEFDDLLLGRVSGDIDDFVLCRGDGTIAYNLAVVVDDACMGVDQVVRGDDLASSTPRQILLRDLLTRIGALPEERTAVEYAHVPLVLGPAGKRLAKRDGAVTLADLRARETSPEQVRAELAASLNLAAPGERATIDDLLERFDPARLPRRPWTWRATS